MEIHYGLGGDSGLGGFRRILKRCDIASGLNDNSVQLWNETTGDIDSNLCPGRRLPDTYMMGRPREMMKDSTSTIRIQDTSNEKHENRRITWHTRCVWL